MELNKTAIEILGFLNEAIDGLTTRELLTQPFKSVKKVEKTVINSLVYRMKEADLIYNEQLDHAGGKFLYHITDEGKKALNIKPITQPKVIIMTEDNAMAPFDSSVKEALRIITNALYEPSYPPDYFDKKIAILERLSAISNDEIAAELNEIANFLTIQK